MSEKMQFPHFCTLPRSAEALVRGGGKIKNLLIAHFVCNIHAKNHQNCFTCVKIRASQRCEPVWYSV